MEIGKRISICYCRHSFANYNSQKNNIKVAIISRFLRKLKKWRTCLIKLFLWKRHVRWVWFHEKNAIRSFFFVSYMYIFEMNHFKYNCQMSVSTVFVLNTQTLEKENHKWKRVILRQDSERIKASIHRYVNYLTLRNLLTTHLY